MTASSLSWIPKIECLREVSFCLWKPRTTVELNYPTQSKESLLAFMVRCFARVTMASAMGLADAQPNPSWLESREGPGAEAGMGPYWG